MEDRLTKLETAVASLTATVEDLQLRLEGVEAADERQSHHEAIPDTVEPTVVDETIGPSIPDLNPIMASVPLLGRTCLVLGGAFLLRALTDAGTLPQTIGVAGGLVYAMALIAAAVWAGGAGRRLSAEFHGVTSVIIAYPLLGEATINFKVMSAGLTAATLTFFVVIGLTAAWYRRLPVTVWAITGAAVTSGLVIARFTYQALPFTIPLLLLGLATVWLSYLRGWFGPRWVAAFGIDLLVLHLALQAQTPGGPKAPWDQISVPAVQALALALFVLYLATFATRALLRHRNVTLFVEAQTAAVLVIGFGSATRIATLTNSGLILLGLTAAVLSGACYAVSFASVDRQLGRGRNFLFFTSLGLILILYGTWMAAPPAAVVLLSAFLAVLAAILGGRFDRITLRAHAAVYTIYAAVASGLTSVITSGLISGAGSERTSISVLSMSSLVSAGCCYLILVVTQSRREVGRTSRLPRFVVSLVAIGGAASLVVTTVMPLIGGATPDPGLLAATRTGVLAIAALAFAAVSRQPLVRELAWLVYPLLALGGIKLVLVDLRVGRPATLFFAFAAYGIALIVAPRLAKSRKEASTTDGS